MFHTTSPASHDAVSFVHQSWPAEPGQLAPIRAEVRRWLASLGVGADTVTDVVLAVNEAVTNAVVHAANSASDRVELTFWTEEGTLCIEIVDHGTWQPPTATITGGWHGIPMMHSLIESVMIHYDARGTRVLLRHSKPQ
jgi:anti-sigma regulatory factor (Ser/Thr protein kinase)